MDLNSLACQDTPESRHDKSSYLQRSLGRSSRAGTPTFMKMNVSSIGSSPKIRPSIPWGHETMNPNSIIFESRYLTNIEDSSRIEFDAETGNIAIDLYEEFLDLYTKISGEKDVFDLLQSYEKLCERTADELKPILRKCAPTQKKYSNINNVIQELRFERNTWRLVRTLYKDRIEHRFDDGDEAEMPLEMMCKQMSDKDLVECYFARNSTVRRCQLVVDWLEKNAADDFNDEYRERLQYFTDQGTVSWEHTLHDLKTKTPLGRPTQDSLITELDPDAPVRQRNNTLHAEDKEIESRLLKIMFMCLRCGNLEEAQRTAENFGYPWLAASLEGWRLFHDPNYDNEVLMEGEPLQPVEGNKYRDIWKAACWRMSQEPKIPMYQQALFGCLSGNLKAIVPACVNWYDYLWAYCRVFVDTLTEKELRSNTQVLRSLEQLPSDYWDKSFDFQQIFHDLNAVESIRKERLGEHALIQKHIILDDVIGLVETMHKWLHDDQPPKGHLLRIMSHLVLFFRTIERPSREDCCVNILEAYVKELIAQQKMPLVARYVATLPPSNQVYWYSRFLEGITDTEERELCLQYAEKANLDTQAITKAVVSNVRSKVSDTENTLSNLANVVTTEEDNKKISALGWLFYDASQRVEALKQSNALLRDFVLSDKLDAARDVMKKIPEDSVSIIMSGKEDILPEEDNIIKEHLCFKSYLEALDVFNVWFNQFQQSNPTEPSPTCSQNLSFKDKIAHEHSMQQYELEKIQRAESLEAQTKITTTKLYNVLLFISGGWMVDSHETDQVDPAREKQMDMIRKLCVPKISKLLHSVFLSTHQSKEIMQLSDILVSDQYNLHKVFDLDELQQLLSLFTDASIQCLKNGYDCTGHPLNRLP